MTEEWRAIAAAPGYEVSSLGRIKRVKGGVRGARVGRILKGFKDKDGYIQVNCSENNKIIAVKVHRAVLIAFFGPPPTPWHESAHDDGDRSNNIASNLLWKTHGENIRDKIRHGTHGVKLNPADVFEIRRLRETGLTLQAIGRRFDLTKTTVGKIVRRDLWVSL